MTTPLERAKPTFTATEERIFEEIRGFKTRETGLLGKATDAIEERLERVADKLDGTTTGEAVDKAASAILKVLNDVSVWSVREEKVYEDFRESGYPIDGLEDIEGLELEAIETVVGGLDGPEIKYRVMATAEGMSTGALGLAGVLVDLPTIVALSLRAIAEYGTYYGFDVTRPTERPFAMLVLSAASSSGQSRAKIFARLEEYIAYLHSDTVDKRVEAAIAEELAEQLAVRLVRGKLAQSLPLVSALFGGAYNENYVHHVCETAQHAFRERWLVRRHLSTPADRSEKAN